MSLPAPNLDDRRFQQLVDDAKRYVQQTCPEWTDHNVSDPGVTLIESFAGMVEQLLYRLNRVPNRNYIKFLEMIGVKLFPPAAARVEVTFWLSAPQSETVNVPAGTQVSTLRTETVEAVVFTAVDDLNIVPSELERVKTSVKEGEFTDRTTALKGGKDFPAFDTPPKAGDQVLIGLSAATERCAVVLRFNCQIEGIGVDPLNPPLVWEARCGKEWVECEIERDETGGLNRAGDVVLHVPEGHTAEVIEKQRAGWLRCRVVETEEGQPAYSDAPKILQLSAFTIGGTSSAVHAEVVRDETIGISDGLPGQHFQLAHRPVVPSEEPLTLEVSGEDGWTPWIEVDNFADSGPEDRHFTIDPINGEIVLGPAVRDREGGLQFFGAVPPKGSTLRVSAYRSGGGRQGNAARGAISVLVSSIPFIDSVENRKPAGGGVDGENVESALVRGPVVFRTRNRAVTTEDFSYLAREAAPEVARVESVAAGDGADAGSVRVLIVPAAGHDELGRMRFEDLIPSPETLEKISRHLDERRTIGARVIVEPPAYQGITVVARIKARPRTSPQRLQEDALRALYSYFHPIIGGPDGDGWPFGRPIHAGEVYSVFQPLRGVEFVQDVRLFGADPTTGTRGKPVDRLDLDAHSLVFSFEHQVLVEEA